MTENVKPLISVQRYININNKITKNQLMKNQMLNKTLLASSSSEGSKHNKTKTLYESESVESMDIKTDTMVANL